MDLQKYLDESGYGQAVKELEDAKALIALVRKNLAEGIPPNAPMEQVLADLLEMELWVPRAEKVLAEEYAAAIKYVDAQNDLELTMLDVTERAELVLEYMETDHPDAPATDEIRTLVEKIRNNEE